MGLKCRAGMATPVFTYRFKLPEKANEVSETLETASEPHLFEPGVTKNRKLYASIQTFQASGGCTPGIVVHDLKIDVVGYR